MNAATLKFGDVIRLRRDQSRQATIMVLGEIESKLPSIHTAAVVLDADKESAATPWWRIGHVTVIYGDDLDRFEACE